MKRTASRKQCKNHLEIIIRGAGKKESDFLEKEVKRAIIKWRSSLDKDMSFEIISIDGKNSYPAM